MAYTLITNGQGSANNDPTTGSLDTTEATLLIATCSYGGTPTGVTDSKGNTWVGLTARTNTGVSTRIFYVNSATPTVGTGHTFTLAGTGIAGAINVLAFSGNTAAPFVEENGTSAASGSTIAPGAVVPTEDGYLVVTGFTGGNTFGGAGTIGASFNITDQKALTGGVNYGTAAAYLIQSTAASVNPTWTLGSTVSNISSAIATFRVAGASGFKKATVNASDVPATQTDFPSYVDLSRLGITTLAEAESVRVYADSAKTTEWAREIVSATEMHVKVPSLTSTVEIFVDWDGVSADYAAGDTYGRNAVWSDYEGVYHMNQDPSGSAPQIIDSTGRGNNLTANGSMTSGDLVSGDLGQAIDYDGSNDYTSNTTTTDFDGATIFSVQAIVKPDTLSTNEAFVGKTDAASWATGSWALRASPSNSSVLDFHILTTSAAGGLGEAFSPTGYFTAGVTKHVHATRNAGTMKIYGDGALVTTDTGNPTGATNSNTGRFSIGTYGTYTGGNFWDGLVSELRYRASELSANWITTEYNNQSDEAGFWGTWSDVGGGLFVPRVSFFM